MRDFVTNTALDLCCDENEIAYQESMRDVKPSISVLNLFISWDDIGVDLTWM